jgi:alpha-mannosidase
MRPTALTPAQRLDRLEVRITELAFWLQRDFVDLDDWSFDGEPIRLGEPWPRLEDVVTLAHPGASVPAEWPLDDARLHLDLGGESLVRVRYAGGGEEAFGLDPEHRRFTLREREFALEATAVARLPFGVPNRDARVALARIVWAEPALERLERRLRLVLEAGRALGAHDVVDPLIGCAERALARLVWPSATRDYLARTKESPETLRIWAPPGEHDAHPPGLDEDARGSVREASVALEAELRALQRRYPPDGALALTGHAHIDLAWLWPMEETRRKAQRTFHTALGLIDRYPELVFNHSAAQLYAFVEEDDPDLFARMQERAAAGEWEPVGGMWVEPDVNMPSGESLVRQLLYGQRYFERKFGGRHDVCWLPDCFGFSPGLPQLLRGAGIDSFFTIKVNWSETNAFPYDLFWWEGIDGSRVLAHKFDNPDGGYNGRVSAEALVATWRNYAAKHHHPESLLSVGYGDGGGGPTADMLERVREFDSFPALPRVSFTHVRDFYARVRTDADLDALPVWVGELYLELHRGTLTTQGRLKFLHRRAERELVAAEALGSMIALAGGADPASLEPLWRVLLRNQFHDILPGSSIRQVNERAEQELSDVAREAGTLSAAHMDALTERLVPPGDRAGLLVVNPDLSDRPLRLELPDALPGGQPVEGGSVLSGAFGVPGLGAEVLLEPPPPGPLEVSESHLENDLVRVELGDDGSLARVWDKRAGRDALAGRGNQLWLYVDKPRNWDAWDIEAGDLGEGRELRELDSLAVVESGPHRAAVRVERSFRDSTIRQDIRLWANSARIDLHTTIDWHERRLLLKARFPLAVRSRTASFETAFGVIERPTHTNTTWEQARFEVAGHRFADLSEPGYGVALLNDGKYGHEARGSTLALSLLRAPVFPDTLADEGSQTFTYALLPHPGSWLDGGALMEAEDLNRPLLARRVSAARPVSWRAAALNGLPLGLGALKPLEDGGGLVLRAYEPQGARGGVGIELPAGWRAEAELNLLEDPQGPPPDAFRPFGVRSWLLRRAARSV